MCVARPVPYCSNRRDPLTVFFPQIDSDVQYNSRPRNGRSKRSEERAGPHQRRRRSRVMSPVNPHDYVSGNDDYTYQVCDGPEFLIDRRRYYCTTVTCFLNKNKPSRESHASCISQLDHHPRTCRI
jgi:hypothetical protein